MAVQFPNPQVRNIHTYGRIVLQLLQKHGGHGRLEYDWAYRLQGASDASVAWNFLNPSLMASTIFAHSRHLTQRCSAITSRKQTTAQLIVPFFQSILSWIRPECHCIEPLYCWHAVCKAHMTPPLRLAGGIIEVPAWTVAHASPVMYAPHLTATSLALPHRPAP